MASILEINNLVKARIDKIYFEKAAKKILSKQGVKNFKISLAFVGDKEIRELNKKYRKTDKVTDVLSFIYEKNAGEIIICYPQIVKQAKERKSAVKDELTLILIHAILHLLGYTDEKEKSRQKMRKKEQQIITQLKTI